MLIDLSGRAGVITGGAGRIGSVTARRLAKSGASIVIADIDEEKGRAVADDICARGGSALFVTTDVSNESDIRRMIEGCTKNFGRIDILINNAHASVSGTSEHLSPEDWDMSYAVLVKAHFLAVKYAVVPMRQGGGGCVINVSSILGKYPVRGRMTYNTAKAAVRQLSRQLAIDYGADGIRVNTITPGDIKPTGDRIPQDPKLVPIGGSGLPEDVANAICFLVSEKASFITGSELVVDGGQSLPFHGQVATDARGTSLRPR